FHGVSESNLAVLLFRSNHWATANLCTLLPGFTGAVLVQDHEIWLCRRRYPFVELAFRDAELLADLDKSTAPPNFQRLEITAQRHRRRRINERHNDVFRVSIAVIEQFKVERHLNKITLLLDVAEIEIS